MKKAFLFLLPALLPAALPAADMTFEGRWLADGVPQAAIDTTCTVNFYETADATDAAGTRTNVTFRTGPDGHFVVTAPVPTNLPDVFWAGVAPEGGSEIQPRMRVAPVPFVLAAAEAVLVTNAAQFTLTGTATVERVETAGDFTVDHLVLLGDVSCTATNIQISNLTMKSLSMKSGVALRFFNAGTGAISPDYDAFEAPDDQTLEAIWKPGSPPEPRDPWEPRHDPWMVGVCSFPSDGILLVAIKTSYNNQANGTYGCVALEYMSETGAYAIQPFEFTFRTRDSNTSTTMRKRFLSIPYRAGEEVRVSLHADGPDLNSVSEDPQAEAWIGAKVRLIPFGLLQGKDQ